MPHRKHRCELSFPLPGPIGPPGPTGATGPAASALTPINNIPFIDSYIAALPLTKFLPGLTGNVSGIAEATGIAAANFGGGNIASGDYSFTTGVGNQSTATASNSQGISTIASNIASHAEGVGTRAIGIASHAEGGYSLAAGDFSHAEGDPTVASGYASHTEGVNTNASGTGAHAQGDSTLASGFAAHAQGGETIAGGDFAHAEGGQTIAQGSSSHAEGTFSQALGSSSHAQGGSTIASGTFAHAQGFLSVSSGLFSHAQGSSLSSGQGSHSEGVNTGALETAAHAEGQGCTASAFAAHAQGFGTVASGPASHAQGRNTTASGIISTAQGDNTVASGVLSVAEGSNTISDLNGTHVLGILGWAAPGTSGSTGIGGNGGEYSWQLAGGSSTPLAPGDGISVIARTAIFGTPQPVGEIITDYFTSASADYAEYFEWADGNPQHEPRVGYFVGLTGEKITLASDNTTVIGVTSRTSNLIGDAAELGWVGTRATTPEGILILEENYSLPLREVARQHQINYTSTHTSKDEIIADLLAELERSIRATCAQQKNILHLSKINATVLDGLTLEEYITLRRTQFYQDAQAVQPVQVIKNSPAYRPELPYVPRSRRPEWIPVGMLGKVYVHDNGACIVGGRCDCVGGIAVPGGKWPVLARRSADVIRILYWNT